VLYNDPRVLTARQPHFDTDLFVGVAVDCSGSMSACDNIIKARRFAVLVAEAAKQLDGIDVRIFGFTDATIYDAGDAERCAAALFEAGGGNNDAAGLLHLANVAQESRRRAKLLVMVSDGLPTECSTQALRSLVERLEKRERMVVAQVAVRKLEEQCFRHHVLLDEDDVNQVVQRFGQTIARLVRKALH
jgi:Mg-chelatase subunit ChlD